MHTRIVTLPNGEEALFTPRTAAHRGFVRVTQAGHEFTISGTVTRGNFEPNPEALNAAMVMPGRSFIPEEGDNDDISVDSDFNDVENAEDVEA